VVGLVGNGILDAGNLDDFVVVESPELRDLHSLPEIPKPFDFDS
jgi:hypothetical protein